MCWKGFHNQCFPFFFYFIKSLVYLSQEKSDKLGVTVTFFFFFLCASKIQATIYHRITVSNKMEISVPSFLLILNHSLVFPLPLSEKREARMEDVIFISNVVFEDRCKHYVTNTLLAIKKGEKKGVVQRSAATCSSVVILSRC